MMKRKLIVLAVLISLLLLLKPLTTGMKVLLFVSQEFPQVPLKPLHSLTSPPLMEKMQLHTDKENIVADLFLPKHSGIKPALIVGMGVTTSDKDKQVILGLCETLARLGYVVLWPRREPLENGISDLEEPQTFIESFNYLANRNEVDKKRISFVGFSVGSSIMLVAAEDSQINERLHGIVFFGGYFQVLDYMKSLFTKTMTLDGLEISWEPSEQAITHVEEIIATKSLPREEFVKQTFSGKTLKQLLYYSPDQRIEEFKTRIFILHEKSDTFVPYVESLKLKSALVGEEKATFHLANLFEHVQPKKGNSSYLIIEFVGLFLFLHNIFMYI